MLRFVRVHPRSRCRSCALCGGGRVDASKRPNRNDGADRLFNQLCLRTAHRWFSTSAHPSYCTQPALLRRLDRSVSFCQSQGLVRVVVLEISRAGGTIAKNCHRTCWQAGCYDPTDQSEKDRRGKSAYPRYLQSGLAEKLGFRSIHRTGIGTHGEGNEAIARPGGNIDRGDGRRASCFRNRGSRHQCCASPHQWTLDLVWFANWPPKTPLLSNQNTIWPACRAWSRGKISPRRDCRDARSSGDGRISKARYYR